MNRLKFLQFWSVAVGSMDAVTGLLLIFAPLMTLRWMQVPPVAAGAWVFLSWMGVFIATVGLSYGLVFRGHREAETVWVFTAMIRLPVAGFLTWKITTGALPPAWVLVAITDFTVAAGQLILLRAGWWKGATG